MSIKIKTCCLLIFIMTLKSVHLSRFFYLFAYIINILMLIPFKGKPHHAHTVSCGALRLINRLPDEGKD